MVNEWRMLEGIKGNANVWKWVFVVTIPPALCIENPRTADLNLLPFSSMEIRKSELEKAGVQVDEANHWPVPSSKSKKSS